MTTRMCASPAFTSAVASDTQVAAADTEISGSNTQTTIKKIFVVPNTHISGNTYRIKAQLKKASFGSASLHIYDEFGNVLSTSITSSSATYEAVSGDITLTYGHQIRIAIYGDNNYTGYAKDVKLCCTETGQTTTWAAGLEV